MANKKFFTALLILSLAAFTATAVFASDRTASFEGDDYTINLIYNDSACPGDAVFVRMKFFQTSKKNKVTKEQFASTTAVLELYNNDKRLDKATFYSLDNSNARGILTLLAGVPLSTWWNPEEKYSIKVTYNLYGQTTYAFELPFQITPKTFISETIELDDRNTGIKTDTSPKRMDQIERLNAILATVNPQGVYQTRAFTAPTTATRRTAFFGDRRVYAYTNGKSSTSLHYGTDYGVPTGTDVTACAAGRVVMAENRISTGFSVVIEHLPGLYSLYYHMSELNVTEGQIVKAGDLIGKSGATGLATGPHLHWEMRLGMVAVNPDFFTQDFTFEAWDEH